jgi:hypothetical protein
MKKQHEYIPNIASDISITDFFEQINFNLSTGLLRQSDLGAFILKLKKITQIFLDENKQDSAIAFDNLGKAVQSKETFEHLGVNIEKGNTNRWVDYKETGDLELVKLYELSKEIQERIEAKLAYWKEIAEHEGKTPRFGISSPKTLTIQCDVPVLRTVTQTINATVPKLNVKTGLKIVL